MLTTWPAALVSSEGEIGATLFVVARGPGHRDTSGGSCHHVLVGDFAVVVGAGALRNPGSDAVSFPHRWTAEGVTVDADFTGAHLLHLAAAGCVLNDVYREAKDLGLVLRGVRVSASGGYDVETWRSTGISYSVELDTAAPASEIDALLERVDAVAEIPKAIRAGAGVDRLR